MNKKQLEQEQANYLSCQFAFNLADVKYKKNILAGCKQLIINISQYFKDDLKTLTPLNSKGDLILDILNSKYVDLYYISDNQLFIEFITNYTE